MSIAINLNKKLVKAAQSHSTLQGRSVQQQVEYWATVGKVVEENPELGYTVVKEILLGLEDVKAGNVEEYKPI